jgi:superfamily II DNA or RNA helicase
MRETNFQQKALFESRRLRLREELAEALPGDAARFIINETKEDNEELVYVNGRTRHVIKDHQVEGVRFMWNQIVVKSKVRQGCLLAHTMGLGKTMQVVTLLVAIAEAGLSKDEALYKQIPKSLRESRTLILCPSGLVNNWIDELNIWTPTQDAGGQPLNLADNEVGYLGCVYKVEGAVPKSQRRACVLAWQASGGVLVIGYPMFLQLSKDPEVLDVLCKTPNIVIADEAHKLKNSTAQIHQVTQNFRTTSRIAMTGSPLTNNVADYYHMISWVAPNYLGPYPEFKQVYENPVVLGLHADSNLPDRRRAVKTLNILRETVSPLVHRMGILTLKDDLPQKKEFILYLKLTPLQQAAYSAYLKRIVYDSAVRDRLGSSMTSIWTFVNDLAVLLAHPSIYKRRLLHQQHQQRQRQQQARQNASTADTGNDTPMTTSPDEGEGDDGETTSLQISADVKSELLATVSTRDLENVTHSWKVVILRTILDECRRIGDKVLVFSQHIATLDFLEEMFRRDKRNWYRLDGKTHSTERQAAVKRFNDDGKAEVYLISTKAGGEGLNIHGANRVVIFDFKYVPMEEQQAVGRAYRIGQTKPVFVYWLIVADTFEESVQNRSVFKLQLASRVVDKKNPLSWSKRASDLFPKDGRLPSIPPKDPDIPHYSGKDVVLDNVLDSPALGDSVRRIIMTETFEEEEPDDSVLTADDKYEIKAALAEAKQRRETGWIAGPNTATAEQQRTLPRPGAGTSVSAGSGSGPSPVPIPGVYLASMPQLKGLAQAGRESHPQAQHKHSEPPTQASQLTKRRLVKILVPEHKRTRQPGDHTTVPSPMPSRSMAMPTDRPIAASQLDGLSPPSPSPTAQQHGPRIISNLAPIAGAGTMFAPSGTDQQSEQLSAPRDQNLVKSVATKQKRLREIVWTAHGNLHGDLSTAAPSPTVFLEALEQALKDTTQYSEDLLLLDFFSSLIRTLEKSPRFSMAIVFGLIDAKELSHMKREQVADLVKKYDSMDWPIFENQLLDCSKSVRNNQSPPVEGWPPS